MRVVPLKPPSWRGRFKVSHSREGTAPVYQVRPVLGTPDSQRPSRLDRLGRAVGADLLWGGWDGRRWGQPPRAEPQLGRDPGKKA